MEDPSFRDADFTGGFSNSSLLIVSLAGLTIVFAFLLLLCYIAPADKDKYGNAQDDGGGGEEVNYDQLLQEADVSTLSRAQRRARARLLMKKSRRLPVEEHLRHNVGGDNNNNNGGDGGGGGGEERPLLMEGNDNNNNNGDANDIVPVHPTVAGPRLSRKERQKAAKELERMERRANEEERKLKMQEEEEERMFRQLMSKEKKERQELEKKEELERKFQSWKYMFPPKEEHESDGGLGVTVNEFVEQMKNQRVIYLGQTADQFNVTVPELTTRLKQLEDDGRIYHGILKEDRYTFIDAACMSDIASFVKKNGCVRLDEIAKRISQVTNNADVRVDEE